MSNHKPDDGLGPSEVEDMRELGRLGVLPSIEKAAKEFTAPFFWYDSEQDIGSRTLGGGTICFIRTPDRLIGVTAAHVHRACLSAVTANPEFSCQVGGHSFRPEDRLIDIDDHLDLATYNISEVQVPAAGAHTYEPATWPPALHDPIEYALAGGWPWRLTSEAPGVSNHQFLHFIGRFNVTSQFNIGMATFRTGSIPWGRSVLQRGTNIGGMSGGPLYSFSLNTLVPLRMVGVIYEFGLDTEQILGRPLSRINPDGSLSR